ncbi:hypothetical protein RFI_16641 [Reticulomyxa filosa]|uniref:Uncharacterized protein n=1 Tax=Reticulomyxa filosa TaxID=46433 RepID=X6N5I6_RETFI|nr:hypothetical protein RFI_16641 [Reticulomyxa filosa]|eukprot:ETO20572.1 hypothetical protein RFI_16641 [Reticulomyxa filosa]
MTSPHNQSSQLHPSVSNEIGVEMGYSQMSQLSTTLTFIREDPRGDSPPMFEFSDADFTQIFPLWHLLARSMESIKTRVDHALALCAHLKAQLLEHKNVFTTAMGPGSCLPHLLWFQVLPISNEFDLASFGLDHNSFQQYLMTWCTNEMKLLNMSWKIYQDHVCFYFDPLQYAHVKAIKMDLIAQFVQKIVVQMNVLRECFLLRRVFQESLATHSELQWVDPVHVNGFVGLGAFRFVPPYFSDPSTSSVRVLNTQLKDDLVKCSTTPNMYLFATDMHEYPVICVNPNTRIFEDKSVALIFDEIVGAVKNLKFPEEALAEMGQAIKMGIESVQSQVKEESAVDFNPDTLIRKIPLFGSIYGWILPSQKSTEHGATGLSFDMISRDIKRTEFVHNTQNTHSHYHEGYGEYDGVNDNDNSDDYNGHYNDNDNADENVPENDKIEEVDTSSTLANAAVSASTPVDTTKSSSDKRNTTNAPAPTQVSENVQ